MPLTCCWKRSLLRAGTEDFNFCKLIAGSEGTLAFLTEIKLNVCRCRQKKSACCAFMPTPSMNLYGPTWWRCSYKPSACELMDHYILECTKDNY